MDLLVKNDVCSTIQNVQKLEEFVAERKQKIKIADASKAGWNTAQHLEKGMDSKQSLERR